MAGEEEQMAEQEVWPPPIKYASQWSAEPLDGAQEAMLRCRCSHTIIGPAFGLLALYLRHTHACPLLSFLALVFCFVAAWGWDIKVRQDQQNQE